MPMSSSATHARDRRAAILRRRLATDRARHALALVLFDAVADGIEFGPRDLQAAEDREWLRGAVAVPIQETADVALDALVWRLADLMGRAPNRLGDRYAGSHDGEELGWD
jgi:hypothetical protein